jgi:hypothetical protein
MVMSLPNGTIRGGDEADYANYAKSLAVDIPEITWKDVGNVALDFTPIIGDIKGGYETVQMIGDELAKDNPNYKLIGILGGMGAAATIIGLVPGAGDVAKKTIMSGARSVAEGANKVVNAMPAYDPSTLGSMGGNIFSGKKGITEVKVPTEKEPGMVVFQGSPHDFEKFDIKAIGTGEGHQAFGHGLYFTDEEDIAKFYKESLSEVESSTKVKDVFLDDMNLSQKAKNIIDDRAQDADEGIIFRKDDSKDFFAERLLKGLENKSIYKEIVQAGIKEKDLTLDKTYSGKTYKAELSATPEEFLDYDKLMSEQPEILKLIKEAGLTGTPWSKGKEILETANIHVIEEANALRTPGELPRDIFSNYHYEPEKKRAVQKLTSERLAKAGIKGIKYSAGQLTSGQFAKDATNYVVFDDKLIKMLAKYGIVGSVGITGAGAAKSGLIDNKDETGYNFAEGGIISFDDLLPKKETSTLISFDDLIPSGASEGVAQEFFEGVASGLSKIPQGILETAALAPDYFGGTDYASDVTEAFEEGREKLGIDPEGVAGAIGEVGSQFVIPGLAAAKLVGAVSKAGKIGTFARQLGAAAATDAVVATNDTTTLGDFFEGGPTGTQQDIGLQGDEEASRRLLNKLKVGVEGGAGLIAAPFIAKGVGAVASEAVDAAGYIPGLPQAARAVKAGGAKIGDYLKTIEDKVQLSNAGPIEHAVGTTLSWLRYRGVLPEQIGESRSLIEGFVEAEAKGAKQIITRLDENINKIVDQGLSMTQNSTSLTRKGMLNSIDKYLTTDALTKEQALKGIPKLLHNDLDLMRNQVDTLSKKIMKSDFIRQNEMVPVKETEKSLKETIRSNLGSYMRKRYKIFEDKDFMPDQATIDMAKRGFKGDREAVENVLKRPIGEGPVTDELASEAVDTFLRRYTYHRRGGSDIIGRIPDFRLNPGLFVKRQNITKFQEALMGRIDDPLENYVSTVADLAEFSAVDDYFGKIRKLADTNPGIAKLFKSTEGMEDGAKADLERQGYTILGGRKGSSNAKGEIDDITKSGWGSLYGYAVPDRVHKDLTRVVLGDLGIMNPARSLYSTFLRAKGFTQYGKTVLSPVTQIRNVSTAAAFAMMQGNVGRGANLFESMSLVFDNIMNKPDALPRLQKLQRLGVINSQAELKELQSLIKQGLGFAEDATAEGLPTARKFGNKFTDNPVGKFVRGVGRKAEDLYQGGDDVWKIYNFEFEKNKLASALKKMNPEEKMSFIRRKSGGDITADDFLDEEAARIVRNTVPNYNLAPEAIRGLRKLPVGNFIAFPYEILRTGMNTVARGIDELADPNVHIQKIGLRRLTGALTTSVILPATLAKMGQEFSGVSNDEAKALQRSGVAPWERNARLIFTGRSEDNTPKYINFSYSNPYDIIEKTIIAALNKFDEGQELGKPGAQIVTEAGLESLSELFAPFTEESIIAGKLRDVLDPNTTIPGLKVLANVAGGRAGQTVTGAKVYRDTDSVGRKIANSFNHVLDALIPSIVPVDVRSGQFQASRFARGLVNSLELNEELGIARMDTRGIERDLTQELARAFTGITESEGTLDKSLSFKGYEFASGRSSASSKFNRELGRFNTSSSDILDAYIEANEDRFRVYNKFYSVINDYKKLGFSDRKIRTLFKNENIGGYKALMKGRYEPLPPPSKVKLQEMKRNETLNLLPRQEIRDYFRSQRDRQFGQSFSSDDPNQGLLSFDDLIPNQGLLSFDDLIPNQSSIPTPAPINANLASMSVQPGAIDPNLLGNNPVNIQLAQRLGRA